MADKSRYVNTASPAGGNGTTNSVTPGDANRAYATLAAAELAERVNLTTQAGRVIFNCTGTTADTAINAAGGFTAANWPGSTASFYVVVQANPGQESVMPYSTTRYRLEPATGIALYTEVPFMRVLNIQAMISAANQSCFYSLAPVSSGGTQYFERCLANVNGQSGGIGFTFGSADSTQNHFVSNCVAYTLTVVGTPIGFSGAAGTDNPYRFYNCTAYGFAGGTGTGFTAGGALTIAKNCLAAGNFVGFGAGFGATSSNNASSDATSPGTSARNTQTFTFINTATADLHITAGDAGARTFGVSLSGDATYPITVDFDGTTRPATWDIGATQITTGAAGYPAAAFFGIPNRMPQPSVRAY